MYESWSDALLESHIQGTTNVVQAAKKSSTVQRFVQTSSIAAIIDPYHEKANYPSFIFDESNYNSTTDPKVNGDYYGYAKCVAEKIAVDAGNDDATNFDTVVINPSVVIGERLCKAHTKASPVFIRQMLYGNEQPLIYFSWVDVGHRDSGQASVHHGYIFLKSKYNPNKDKRMKITLHELMHTQGFAFLCNKGHYGNSHMKNTIAGGPEGGDKFSLGKMYDHGDETCPDLKDSVFLEPKSAKPFNPVELKCAMAAEVGRGIAPNPDYKWRERYSHKKITKIKKNRTWCSYNRYKNFKEN